MVLSNLIPPSEGLKDVSLLSMSSKPLGAAVKILPRRRASTTETPIISPSLLTTGPPLMPPREPEKFGTRRISAQAKTGSYVWCVGQD